MKNLYLVGAGSAASEILEFVCEVSNTREWTLRGLLDDDPEKVGKDLAGFPVVSTLSNWQPSPEDLALCTIGDPLSRAEIWKRISEMRVPLATLIHPLSYVAPSASVGEGSIVYPFAQVSSFAQVGNNVLLNFSSSVGHHAVIGESTVLSAHADVTGSVRIGKRVLLGSHATIAPSVTVGDDARVAMGSAVITNVAKGQRVIGVPARQYRL